MVVVVVFGILAVMCMAYYIVMISYAGVSTSFSPVWLAAAVICAIIAVAAFVIHKKCIKLPLGLRVTLISILGIAVAFFIAVEAVIVSGMVRKPSDNLDYIIVLGAQVRGTRITKSLKKRLETACDYLERNPDTVAVVSGGQGIGEDISEAQAMYDYLIEHGINEERIIIEDKSTSTQENIELSMDIIYNTENAVQPDIGIVTNNFHVYRATAVCEKMGYQVQGVSAGSDEILFGNYMLREFFAVVQYRVTGKI